MSRWKLLNTRTILSNKWLTLNKSSYKTSHSSIVDDYYTIKRGSFVLVVATEQNSLILVRQFRAATNKFYWSLPAGYIAKGEDPRKAAKRELLEETGFRATKIKLVGRLDPLPGYINSPAYVIYCNVHPNPSEPTDSQEVEKVAKINFDRVTGMIKEGKIDEMQTVAAILLVKAKYPSNKKLL